jgi:hypothetical protein
MLDNAMLNVQAGDAQLTLTCQGSLALSTISRITGRLCKGHLIG